MSQSTFFHGPDLDNFVLVYTMGKVGSTAIVRSLQAAGAFCRHLQWLRPETQEFMDRIQILQGKPNSIDGALNRLNQQRAYRALRDGDYARLVKVITAVRTPIELILSHYFHSLGATEVEESNGRIEAGAIIQDILDGVEHFMKRPDRTVSDLTNELSRENYRIIFFCWIVYNYLTWFDLELLPFFGTPIVEGHLTDGYQLAGNVMIVKFEELGCNGERAIAAYSQKPNFKLLRENVGANKEYGQSYSECLRTIRFPRDFVEYLCGAKYVRHFYSEGERQAQKSRWSV